MSSVQCLTTASEAAGSTACRGRECDAMTKMIINSLSANDSGRCIQMTKPLFADMCTVFLACPRCCYRYRMTSVPNVYKHADNTTAVVCLYGHEVTNSASNVRYDHGS
jgi:hypothetical protein